MHSIIEAFGEMQSKAEVEKFEDIEIQILKVRWYLTK